MPRSVEALIHVQGGHQEGSTAMAIRSTRIAASLAVSVAIGASVAPTAGARIPESDWGEPAPAYEAAAAAPDAFERAVQRRLRPPRAAVTVLDAFERAAQRRMAEIASTARGASDR
jgi:hypothetical protein